MDWQTAVVALVAAGAALYAGRAFLRQFLHRDDEPTACAHCPALEAFERGRVKASGASGAPPAPGSR